MAGCEVCAVRKAAAYVSPAVFVVLGAKGSRQETCRKHLSETVNDTVVNGPVMIKLAGEDA